MKKTWAIAGAFLALCFTLGLGCLAEYAVSWQAAAVQPVQTAQAGSSGICFIHTEEELRAIGSGPEALRRHYVLAGDITLQRPWTPIGSRLRPFTGTFDGNGHVIYGLTAAKRGAGMFGSTRGAVIRNVVLERATVQNGSASPIAGDAQGTRIEGCSINAPRSAPGAELPPEDAAAL